MRKRILITGASGLLGSHLVEMLLQEDQFELFLLSRSREDIWRNRNVHIVEINFAENWDINELPGNLHAIIHLSQAENFRNFPEAAKEVFYINTVSTMRLIDHAAKTNVSHFIYASSGAVYGSDGIFNEQEPVSFRSNMGFYTGTKLCSEVLLDSYSKLLQVITLRFFFIYGKGQRKEMLLPRLVGFVKKGHDISLEGKDGLEINPVHATDAAKAVIAALKLTGSHTINIAGPEICSLRKIVETIGNELATLPKIKSDETKQSKSLIADITAMKQLLITPTIKITEGIKTLL
jgi:nucleoside-diphosphate-sugar epimerase